MYPHIRKATAYDVDRILEIARQYRAELGYLHPVGLRQHISAGTVNVCEWYGNIYGFVEYHARRDGWQTIRHIATDKHAAGQGIGRNLLYSVPCPFRLKTTADNITANTFYHNAGLRVVAVENGRRRQLLTYELKSLFILVKGGSKSVPEIARASGMAYGTRGDYSAYGWPYMVDIHWQNYDWSDYMQKIAAWRPVQAMAADYEHPSQRRKLYRQIRDLRAAGVMRVMVCPKFDGAIQHIPSWCIVALSVPSTYAGWLPSDFRALAGRRVHLLGGSAQAQRDIAARVRAVGGIVLSADGSHHTIAAAYGRVFDGSRWVQTSGENTHDLMIRSGVNIVQYLQSDPEQLPLAI